MLIGLSLTYRGNANYYKSVHLPLFTLPVGIGYILVVFETNQQAPLLNRPVEMGKILGGGWKFFKKCWTIWSAE